MLFHLVKKNFMVIKIYLLPVLALDMVMPLFFVWEEKPEAGILGFVFICVFSEIPISMAIAAKDCQYPKAATLLSISPYSRDLLVVSMYVACALVFAVICVIFWMETWLFKVVGGFQVEIMMWMYAAFALVVSAFLPFLYKFGYEKFRAFQIVIYCVFGLGVSRFLDAGISIKRTGFLLLLRPCCMRGLSWQG